MARPTGFDFKVAPAVDAAAYAAGDIVGGLLTFPVGVGHPCIPMVTGVIVAIKAAITPALTLVLFDSDPSSTTQTNNTAYALNAADVFKVIKAITGFTLFDHGTPNTYSIEGLNIPCRPVDGVNLYGLLVDTGGSTPTSTSDYQVRLRGFYT